MTKLDKRWTGHEFPTINSVHDGTITRRSSFGLWRESISVERGGTILVVRIFDGIVNLHEAIVDKGDM